MCVRACVRVCACMRVCAVDRGHAVAQWLRHCATNRKVMGSIPDHVIGIFYLHNPSGRPMALGLIDR
jgi:hypothetical protein